MPLNFVAYEWISELMHVPRINPEAQIMNSMEIHKHLAQLYYSLQLLSWMWLSQTLCSQSDHTGAFTEILQTPIFCSLERVACVAGGLVVVECASKWQEQRCCEECGGRKKKLLARLLY